MKPTKLLVWMLPLVLISIDPTSSYTPQKVVICGGGIGGLSSAFDARHLLRPKDEVIVVSDRPQFQFTPSNPWVSTRFRSPEDISLDLASVLPKHNIQFVHDEATQVDPEKKILTLKGGFHIDYDYLISATGPRLAFDEIPGLAQHGLSVCTTPHASETADAIDKLVEHPGPVVVGATQGASCFGPAYEFVLLLKKELEKRGGRDLLSKVPITFVTSEPYVGHLGLGGTGDSHKILTKLLEDHQIESLNNARIQKVTGTKVQVEQLNEETGRVERKVDLPTSFTMLIPPFRGHDVWKQVPGLTDDLGMVLVNDFQQALAYPDIFATGVGVHLPSVEKTVVPTGLPMTGYMIESMGTAAVTNIRTMMDWREKHQDDDKSEQIPLHSKPLFNGLCITDFGDDGAIFVAMPQARPRKHDWTLHGRAATLAKLAFEQYFLQKIRTGDCDPYYEKYMLKLIGIERTATIA